MVLFSYTMSILIYQIAPVFIVVNHAIEIVNEFFVTDE
jgi:hypothetical protein